MADLSKDRYVVAALKETVDCLGSRGWNILSHQLRSALVAERLAAAFAQVEITDEMDARKILNAWQDRILYVLQQTYEGTR
jgi:hypothetical protein